MRSERADCHESPHFFKHAQMPMPLCAIPCGRSDLFIPWCILMIQFGVVDFSESFAFKEHLMIDDDEARQSGGATYCRCTVLPHRPQLPGRCRARAAPLSPSRLPIRPSVRHHAIRDVCGTGRTNVWMIARESGKGQRSSLGLMVERSQIRRGTFLSPPFSHLL
jgi:hypothetical protein